MVNMSRDNSATSKLDKNAIERGICLRFGVEAAIDASILAGNAVNKTREDELSR